MAVARSFPQSCVPTREHPPLSPLEGGQRGVFLSLLEGVKTMNKPECLGILMRLPPCATQDGGKAPCRHCESKLWTLRFVPRGRSVKRGPRCTLGEWGKIMNCQLLLPLLTTTFVAIAGWLAGHTLNARRDLRNKKREIRVQYLLEAYRRLEAGTCRGSIHGTDFAAPFESAIADIQLLGTIEQARMAKELATAIAQRRDDASAGTLLMSLRDALREELNLDLINEKPVHFRLKPGSQ